MGFGLMRNVDIEAQPGAVKVQKKTITVFHTSYSSTFTAVAGTDTCTSSATLPETGTAVTVSTTTTLPAGLAASTNYFLIKLSSTTFKLATTVALASAGTPIDITDAGTGTHTVTTVNPGTVNHIIEDPRTNRLFYQDSNARVWYRTSSESQAFLLNGNTLTNGNGNGMVLFRNSNSTATYLIAFRNAAVDIVNVFGTTQVQTPSWTNSWNFGGAVSDTALNTAAGTNNSHHAIVGQDNIIYFVDDRYVGSIRENSGTVFDPSDTGTYTGSDQALDMPQGEVNQWLEELGVNLLVAGGSYDKIYPWDRTSSTYNLPISVPENSIKRLKNIGNTVYILAGAKGNIYSTQGTYVKIAKKLPDYVVNNSGTILANPVTWGGIATRNGALIFGAAVQTTGNSGVYLLYPDGRLVIDNIPYSGSGNAVALYAKNDLYEIGHASGASTADTSRYSSYETVVHSQLYQVGNKTEKSAFHEVELQLAKPASTGHARIGYRTDTSSSFNTIATFTADGSNTSFNSDIGLQNLENIQIQVEADGDVEIMEIRLIP